MMDIICTISEKLLASPHNHMRKYFPKKNLGRFWERCFIRHTAYSLENNLTAVFQTKPFAEENTDQPCILSVGQRVMLRSL